jgi:signal transduction histidine kinase/ActR/RegA family two-component response regulator
VISAYFEPMLILEDKEEISSQLGIENIREKLTESKEFQVQGRISHDGEDSYIQLAFFRMQENDIRKDFIVAYRDVTSQVLKEEQRKQTLREALYNAEVASNAKTNFLFNMSHDIRTPMNAILGFTQIAREDMDNTERVRECLAKVEQASKHLLRLINDILDMARIESGKIELRPVVNQISFGVMETREVFQPEMREKGISFRTELKNIENDYVFCDTLRIRQIVWNLLSNSLKYTRIGGHVLYQVIQTGKEEQGFAYYELHVKDDGIGISEEFQEHLFDIFERERTSTESGVEGTGLGLAITKRLVDLMGGRIEVHSKEGVGSEFIVYLKMETAACEQPAAEETAAITSEDSFSGKRVLLAEDNELNQEIAEIILSEHGFQVETAKDGMEAVEMIQTSQPGDYDLVLMDIQMPRLNGYEATMKIRALEDPELSRIPIIAMTANAFEEDRKKAKASGMNGHIAKPIDISVLMETLTGLFCLKKGEEAEI